MANRIVHTILPDGLPAPIQPDRGGYTVTMREDEGAAGVLDSLDGEDRSNGLIHLGWGSFRNLDIVAARRSAGAILLDINLHQFRVWDAVRAAMLDDGTTDACSFVAAVVPRLPHQPRLRQFADSTHDWILADLERPGSWLFEGRPERFHWIRDLFRRGNVATGCIDLRAARVTRIFDRLRERMDAAESDQGAIFDTLYVSNVPWMLAQNEAFYDEGTAGSQVPDPLAALAQARTNLGRIAGRFRHVVSAMHLAPVSKSGNLQWDTQLRAPEDFLDPSYWSALTPVAEPFRSIR